MANAKRLTPDELEEILADVLTSPLYSPISYSGAENVWEIPGVVTHYCPDCRQDLLWDRESGGKCIYGKISGTPSYIWKDALTHAVYKCRNCKEAKVTVYTLWSTDNTTAPPTSQFQKVGQYPPVQDRIDPELEKELDREDRNWYLKAIRCRNFGMGLAACGYLRRVIERRINSIIDFIIEIDNNEGHAPNLQDLEKIKKSRMSDRLDFAGKLLPVRLKPGGRNPLDGLYAVVSDAIHQRTEEECLETFDIARVSFEYLFKKLRSELDQAEAYAKALDALGKTKNARKS